MESQLGKTQFLAGEKMTTADISLYAYTHVSDEGGFDLASYPNIQAWLKRIEAHPNYSAMS
jgi:glutathione S-transferase